MLLLIEEVVDELAAVEVLDGLLVELLVAVSSCRAFGRMVVIVSLFSSFVAVVSVVDDSELADNFDVVETRIQFANDLIRSSLQPGAPVLKCRYD